MAVSGKGAAPGWGDHLDAAPARLVRPDHDRQARRSYAPVVNEMSGPRPRTPRSRPERLITASSPALRLTPKSCPTRAGTSHMSAPVPKARWVPTIWPTYRCVVMRSRSSPRGRGCCCRWLSKISCERFIRSQYRSRVRLLHASRASAGSKSRITSSSGKLASSQRAFTAGLTSGSKGHASDKERAGTQPDSRATRTAPEPST
jgi:hypothetical protein